MKNRTLAALLGIATTATAITLVSNPASAGTFNVTFDIDTTPLTPVNAQLITEDTLSTISGFTGYKVLSITGTQGADPISGLYPPPVPPVPPSPLLPSVPSGLLNDNLFNPANIVPVNGVAAFSQGGLAYLEGGNIYRLIYDQGTYMGCLTPCRTVSDLQIVPEPTSTLSLLSLGILGAGATLKRKLKPSKSIAKETTKVG